MWSVCGIRRGSLERRHQTAVGSRVMRTCCGSMMKFICYVHNNLAGSLDIGFGGDVRRIKHHPSRISWDVWPVHPADLCCLNTSAIPGKKMTAVHQGVRFFTGTALISHRNINWATDKFCKVMRQHIWSEVTDYIIDSSTVHCRMQQWKNRTRGSATA